ncbi:MAG: cadmium-translocating P-type ATPase [Gammaproteobacteria bacterium]|nr:cadmium-translocating P-type ATPase [Gammaproteobacteria bacterium]MBU1654193.1 cadmium-translocating P-type ATPase [Gammaproteobacteria bacterium]MBU1959667.1 cadmium-translocating P-type ATPase [Gammaproteobacteria bacterium]
MAKEAEPEQQCFHCGQPVPPGCDYRTSILGEERPLCCLGCYSVAQAILAGGLENFYLHRTAPSNRVEDLVPEGLRQMELYDQPRLQGSFVSVDEESLRSASLILEGITCAACVWLNEKHVGGLPGVLDFNVNYSTHRARVRWDETRIHLSDILKAITAIGYVAHPFDPGRQEAVFKKERSIALRRLAVAGLGTMQVMMLAVPLYSGADGEMMHFLRLISMIVTIPVLVYSAQSFFIAAWRDLRHRRVGMDVPVSLAIAGAFGASAWSTVAGGGEVYFESVCMFAFFLLTSRFLEMSARQRAGQAAESLVKMLPSTAIRLTDAGQEAVAVADLLPGDRVLVKPGETVPVDGVVIEGASSVDESLLTGESLPRAKEPNDPLIGGSLNVESPLVLRVEKVGEDTLVSAIVRLLDRAQAEKPRIALVADRIAGWFLSALLLLAVAVALWWAVHDPSRAFVITLSVLVVSCPCALSLATPAAVTAATGALTRKGLLITRGHALETLARATHIVFDKTGTLTQGRLRLESIIPVAEGMTPDQALAIAAALESRSEHPVARLLVQSSDALLQATELESRPGQGVEGQVEGVRYRIGSLRYVAGLSGADNPLPEGIGTTRIALGNEKGIVAWLELSDSLREDAALTLQELRSLGLQPIILSGDVPGAVAAVAKTLGIDHYRGGLRPEDKLEQVRAIQAQGGVVVMVGDGVNDAPVLAGSEVSLAVGSGSQLAHASADMILLSEQLRHIAEGVRTARRTLAIIRQNLGWALLYNAVAIPLAAAGFVLPWVASLGMSASSLIVVLNSLRLRIT